MIGNCDACDRQNVPVSNCRSSSGETAQCFLCQGNDNQDPYCEASEMKLNLTEEWCMAAADREGDSEVGAGGMTSDFDLLPVPTEEDDMDGWVREEIAEECFVRGAQAIREMLARFVEQGGDTLTAASIRANWNPNWGADPGKLEGGIPTDAWSSPAAVEDAMAHFRETANKLPRHDETMANLDALKVRR